MKVGTKAGIKNTTNLVHVYNKIGNMTTFAMFSGTNVKSAFRLGLHDSEVKLKESINEIYFCSNLES